MCVHLPRLQQLEKAAEGLPGIPVESCSGRSDISCCHWAELSHVSAAQLQCKLGNMFSPCTGNRGNQLANSEEYFCHKQRSRITLLLRCDPEILLKMQFSKTTHSYALLISASLPGTDSTLNFLMNMLPLHQGIFLLTIPLSFLEYSNALISPSFQLL